MLAIPLIQARWEAYPINRYNVVHAGAKSHGGGRNGGCLSFMYRSCAGFQVPASFEAFSDVDLGVEAPGWEIRPEPIPRPSGRRMEIGALLKIEEGRVSPGMYDMVGVAEGVLDKKGVWGRLEHGLGCAQGLLQKYLYPDFSSNGSGVVRF
jgi:hypothetical protein